MDKAIIFDMDGVIFDTEHMIWEVWKEVAKVKGILDIDEVLFSCLGGNVTQAKEIFIKKYGEDFAYDTFRKEADAIWQKKIQTSGIPIKEGIKELLAYLKEKGYKIALASSTKVAIVRDELTQAGLLHYFQEIIGGDMVSRSKPDPEIYQVACAQLKVDPTQTMAIEDSFNGIRSAYAAGLKTIMVPDIMQPDEEINSMLFKKFDSLLEVKDFFESQDSK